MAEEFITEITLPSGEVVEVSSPNELSGPEIQKMARQLSGQPEQEDSTLRSLAAEFPRVAGAIVGGYLGARRGPAGLVIGSILGAAAAEPVAQSITNRKETTGETVANIGLAGFNPAGRATSVAGRIMSNAKFGAGLGLAYSGVRSAVDTGGLPSLEDAATSTLGGAAFSGAVSAAIEGAGKVSSLVSRIDNKAPRTLGQANQDANQIATGKPIDLMAMREKAQVKPVAPKPESVILQKKAEASAASGQPINVIKPKKSVKAKKVAIDDIDAIEAEAEAQAKAKQLAGVSSEPTVENDKALYDAIQKQMSDIGHDKAGTPEYQAMWKASEEIKNRHGGMPPGQVSGEAPVKAAPVVKAKKPVATPAKPSAAPATPQFVLPKDLKGAKPNYGFGGKNMKLDFESDLSKALFIIARNTPSKRDADYLRLVMAYTGMDEAGARALGKQVSNQIKNIAVDARDGETIVIPSLIAAQKKAEVAPVAAKAPAKKQKAVKAKETPVATPATKAPEAAKPVNPTAPVATPPVTPPPPKPPVKGSTPPADNTGERLRMRGSVKRELDSDISKEYKESIKNDESIMYRVHEQRKWVDEAEQASAKDLEAALHSSIPQDKKSIFAKELSNRYAAEGKLDEARKAFLDYHAKTNTLAGQMLSAAKMVRTAIGAVIEAEVNAEKLGGKLSKEQSETILKLAQKEIDTKKAYNKADRIARENPTKATIDARKEAWVNHYDAHAELEKYRQLASPRQLSEMLVKFITGNLLSTISTGASFLGNAAKMPVGGATMSLATIFDYMWHAGYVAANKVSRTPIPGRSVSQLNPLPSVFELQQMARGLKVASKEFLTGPSAESYGKAEVQAGFQPLRALIQSMAGTAIGEKIRKPLGIPDLPLGAKGKESANQRALAFIEGTFGVPPEVMFRLLSISDKPFRYGAEARALLELADIRGLKGKELEKFLALPDAEALKFIAEQGKAAVFAQDNPVIRRISYMLDNDLAKVIRLDEIPGGKEVMKVMARIQVPFRQFPVNYILSAVNYAIPSVGFGKSLFYAIKALRVPMPTKPKAESLAKMTKKQAADEMATYNRNIDRWAKEVTQYRRKSVVSMAEGLIGTIIYAAAGVLFEKGLMSEQASEDSKGRSIQAQRMGAGMLNVSGLSRASVGGDSKQRPGDILVNWTKLGIPAAIFGIEADRRSMERIEAGKTGFEVDTGKTTEQDVLDSMRLNPGSVMGFFNFMFEQSFLAGTNSLLDALKDTSPDSPFLKNWFNNTFRAATASFAPNTLDALARAQTEYAPELRGKDNWETLGNIWNYKMASLSDKDQEIARKIDVWGNKIRLTPEGKNPYVHMLLDPLKIGQSLTDKNSVDAKLAAVYDATQRPDVYPTEVTRLVNKGNISKELEPEDYQSYREAIGKARRQATEEFVNSYEFDSLSPLQKGLVLQRVYNAAATQAAEEFWQSSKLWEKYWGPESTVKAQSINLKGLVLDEYEKSLNQ